MREQNTILAGFVKSDITPEYPVSIAGYFNDRISEGVLDPLYLRAAIISHKNKNILFLQIDSCYIPSEDMDLIKKEISRQGRFREDEVMISAIHTHTGPSLETFYESTREEKYVGFLKSTILTVARDIKADTEVILGTSDISYEDLAYNRRWFMKNGKVATNPPKLHADRVKPEGPVDRNLRLISFHNKEDKVIALFCNISNHTDTIGGNLISADWPGIMEKEVQEKLNMDIPVLTLIAPQGNINHYDFESPDPQSGYEEAQRIGKAYAEITLKALSKTTPAQVDAIQTENITIDIPPREVTEDEILEAKNILEQYKNDKTESEKLDANDIFKGTIAVKKIFAENLLNFVAHKKQFYKIPLQIIRMGNIIFFAIPGEPFVEIGLKLIKTATEKYGYTMVYPAALTNGYFGYIPLAENFPRGGYEVKQTPGNPLSRTAANKITETFIRWMEMNKH